MRGARPGRTIQAIAAFLLLGLPGCASNAHMTRISGLESLSATDAQSVMVRPVGEADAGSWEVLGKVYAYERGGTIFSKPSEKSMFEKLASLAASLGADVVLGAQSSPFNGKQTNTIHRWASGVAARSTEDPDRTNLRTEFVVAILPVVVDDSEEGAQREKWLSDAAQYRLEEKGYYTVPLSSAPTIPPGGLAELSGDALNALGGPWADLIFTVELVSSTGDNLLLAASDAATVRASLFSKATQSIVWQNETSGDQISIGLFNVLAGGRMEKAIYEAVKNALESLEPVQMQPVGDA
jgi:hypothetical protein